MSELPSLSCAPAAFDDCFSAELAELAQDVCASGVPGVVIAVSHGANEVCGVAGVVDVRGGEPARSTSRFALGCLTHGFVSCLVHEFGESGRIDFDSPVATYLQELHESSYGREVTIRHLLAHSTGYGSSDQEFVGPQSHSESSSSNSFARLRRVFKPGTLPYYTPRDTRLLLEITRRLEGRDFSALFPALLERLGIGPDSSTAERRPGDMGNHVYNPTHRRFEWLPPPSELPPQRRPILFAEDLRLALPDLLRAYRTILRPEGSRKLSFNPALMLQGVAALPPPLCAETLSDWPLRHGLGCAQFFGGMYGYNGVSWGQCGAVRIDPARDRALAVGLNVPDTALRNRIVKIVSDRLAWNDAWIAQPSPKTFSHEWQQGVLGHYVADSVPDPMIACVKSEDHGVICELSSARGRNRTLRLLERNRDDLWQPATEAGLIAIRFLHEQSARAVGLMLGTTVLWREAGT